MALTVLGEKADNPLIERWQLRGGHMSIPLPADGLQQPSDSKLSITDATAVFAWCENGDEIAGAWLCEKYRPLILHIAGRQFRREEMRQDVADETLRRALSAMADGPATRSLTSWFAQIALQVCSERERAIAALSARIAGRAPGA